MTSSRIECAVKHYRDSLQLLSKILKAHTSDVSEEQHPSDEEPLGKRNQLKQQVLAVLAARDEVQAALEASTQTSGETLAMIVQLDEDLKQDLATLIQQDRDCKEQSQPTTDSQSATPVIQLASWRASINPKKEAWWWFFEVPETSRWWNRFDWFWSAVSVAGLTVSLSLVGDISPRFLTGGPDLLGTLAVSTQSILTLLTGGSLLTKEGRKAAENILSSFLDRRFWQEAGAASSVLLLLLLGSFRLSLPQIAVWYNDWGFQNYRNGQWSSAESDYNRALQLNPDYAEAHFNLGLLYEDLRDFDKARTQYKIALQGGLATAHNNLARLYILDKNNSAAIDLLLKAIDPTKKRNLDDETKKTIYKNLGWARLQQKRYAEAEFYLHKAIELHQASKPENNWAAPHCLLAQVLEGNKEQKEALAEWEICAATANINLPDEDTWSAIASRRLEAEENLP